MTDENTRHNEKMKKIKAARDKIMETKHQGKGLDHGAYEGGEGEVLLRLWDDYALYCP